MDVIVWIILLLTILFVIYKYLTFNFNYFRDHNVPHKKPIPLFGNQFKFFAKQQSIPDFFLEIGNDFRDEAYVGFYECRTPSLFVLSSDAVKQICIKNFDNFVNHSTFSDGASDELLISSVFFMKDQKWRDMRATLSPAFTGSKMRLMFSLVRDCADNFVSYCNEKCEESGRMEFRPKEVFSKVTIDIIATCAFGLQIDSLREPENMVYQMFSKIMEMKGIGTVLKFLVLMLSKDLAKWLGVSFLPKDTTDFIKKLVADTISHRKKTKEYRPDVIQLLIEAMEGKLKHETIDKDSDDTSFAIVKESNIDKKGGRQDWSDMEIAAQCFIFFVGGFDTTSNLFNFISYELAVDPVIQERLYQEIRKTQESLEGSPVTYDAIQKMQYMDAFICECLRKHPPMLQIDRVCNKETVIHDGKGNSFKIPVGMKVNLNPFAMHYNPKYFPNPAKFDPDRFLGENKNKIEPNTFLSFGVGPRACIGRSITIVKF